MAQCKSCLSKAESDDGHCPVCGIEQAKRRRELSPAQKRVRRAARHIRLVALFHLLLAAMLILMLPDLPKPFAIVSMAGINTVLAFGLIRFSFWGYRVAVAVYFLVGIVFIISVNIPFALIVLLLLYFVGNGTAKAIFERRARELT